jgi:heat shock protein HspQ
MTDIAQLPALICLYDDPSESVRHEVLGTLAGFGDELEASLNKLPEKPEASKIASVLDAVSQHVQSQHERDTPSPPTTESATLDEDAVSQEGAGDPAPRYEEGQLVRHRRYGYRGVVVAFDRSCHAADEWYESNRTRPERDQPWYHVLVDGAHHVTYAAQTSLLPDESMQAVSHPLVPFFFKHFKDGSYERNDRAWPALES